MWGKFKFDVDCHNDILIQLHYTCTLPIRPMDILFAVSFAKSKLFIYNKTIFKNVTLLDSNFTNLLNA